MVPITVYSEHKNLGPDTFHMIKLVNILLQITEFGKLIESVSSLYSNHTNSIETDKMKCDFCIFS